MGLTLKQPGGAAAAQEPANATPAVGHPSSTQRDFARPNKRKNDAPPVAAPSSAIKKPRTDSQTHQTPSALHKKKSVTFGDTPTKNGTTKAGSSDTKAAKRKKGKSSSAKKQAPPAPTDIKFALDYLRQWKTSPDGWKFNKKLQTLLIKRAFEADEVPASDIDTFYEYIQDLKGFVRQRLRETAMEIQEKDVADGPSGFPAGTKNLEEKQESYETLLSDLLRAAQLGRKRKGHDEVAFAASSSADDVVIRRVVKRMRAEIIIEELTDGESSDASQATQSSKSTLPASDGHVLASTNGGTLPRLHKDNTAVKPGPSTALKVDDKSSSESDSDSETSDASSTSADDSDDSDSDETEEEEEEEEQEDEGFESSSSESSSSSSSADDSDSDDDTADDDD